MSSVGIKGYSYCLNHTPELGLHYGSTPFVERETKGESDFLKNLPRYVQTYEKAAGYAPNQAYIGGIDYETFQAAKTPWIENYLTDAPRYGRYGEIMPEDEFLGLMALCDVFDLIWLEKSFAEGVKAKLLKDPVMNESIVARLKGAHELAEIETEVKDKKGRPLYYGGKVVGCVRSGHEIDDCLFAYVLMENLACKAGGVLALLHLLKNSGTKPEEIDFVIECSEEGAGDMNQRAGGNFAKAVAEIGRDYEAFLDGEELPLTQKELQLLAFFATSAGRKFSVEQLYQGVWGGTAGVSLSAVKTHISNLRRKLETGTDAPFAIRSVRGEGYVFTRLIEEAEW